MSSSEDDDDRVHPGTKDEEIDETERTTIRSELASLTFEELQKLKERIGAKVYNEALFGNKKKEEPKIKIFKRENKNRPREMSSKKPVPMVARVGTAKKHEIRDPRFDPLCGDFDKGQFKSDYSFISDIRLNDIKALKSELRETEDPERKEKLKRLLQRLTEQHRVSKKNAIQKEKAAKEKASLEQEFKAGKQPVFKNKSEARVEALVAQYEELRREGAGRVQRHLKRRQQKLKKRSGRAPPGLEGTSLE